ncbi:PucR family transcriptional regulator [Phytoactinopolyspora limicola]|uniref:PucR family transcriptional regulator n=1 Tax=Phytoactinopolyspora limicola TaxID=2715536 RepID=UPI001409C37C|nr:PucR family transcriptional regulator [Phytoactinopolyspora limicola]
MELSLQQLLDALAERVGRPAVLEDRFMRLIAYSSHDQPIDGVREDSILRRHASPEVTSWLKEFGLPDARRPLRLPANPDLHMLARVCIPVLHKDKALGYLWFVDSDDSMSSADIDFCVREAAELADHLHRESVASLFSAARLNDAMHMLLSDSPLTQEAAQSLEETGYIDTTDGIAVAVLQPLSGEVGDEPRTEEALSQAMIDFQRLARRGQALELVRRDHCVLLLACPGDDDAQLSERIELAHELVQARLAAAGRSTTLVVGVGGRRGRLDHAIESFREARMSADAARLLSGLGSIVHWSRLGIHQIVVELASMNEHVPRVHAGLGRLLEDPESLPLLETLETYLDVAGNAQATAERLNLHRTSLYYRLQRVEQLANTDLKDGIERLALHLALKVARMTGQYAPRRGSGPGANPANESITPPEQRTAKQRVAIR